MKLFRNRTGSGLLCSFTLCLSALCLAAVLALSVPERALAAAAVPPEGVHTTLGDAAYVDQGWLDRTFILHGNGFTCTMGIGEMKDVPVCIHDVGGTLICELKDTSLPDAFLANINNALAAGMTENNSVLFDDGTTSVILTSKNGYALTAEAKAWVLGILHQRLMEAPADIEVTLEDRFLTPVATDQQLSLSADFVTAGSCTTSFASSGTNRSTNIRVAASHLDGMVLLPGQSVSVSGSILPRTEANGYLSANAYLNGKIVQQTGGGICQVSSTVYNAARNSGMAVLERHPHSMPVHYLPLGMDAAISSGSKDLIFQNPYAVPVVLRTFIENKHLTVDILVPSGALNGTTYRFWSKQTDELTAEAFVTTSVNGQEVSTVSVGRSKYKALPAGEEA